MRYTVTHDGLLVTGSETGMVKLAEERIAAKGRVGPGQCIGVDLDTGRFYGDAELKDELAARKPFGQWTARTTRIDDIVKADAVETPCSARRSCAGASSRSATPGGAGGHPAPDGGGGERGRGLHGRRHARGRALAQYRGLHHYFRQTFSQVTNPPIDSLRETRVMTLKTRLGNLGNILDEDPTQCDMLMLDSPVLSNAEFDAMRAYMGATACEVDCTFAAAEGEAGLYARARPHPPRGGGGGPQRLRPRRPDRPGAGAGARAHPDDPGGGRGAHAPRAPLAPHLRQRQRPRGGALDVHYLAVLIGAGATTVNAYLAQESIADRHRRGLFGDLKLRDCVARYKKAVDKGLLKVMSKMGISVLSSYRGGMNFEAIGLSRAW
jgi:glutamate synthase (NADPH/NADH) large chain